MSSSHLPCLPSTAPSGFFGFNLASYLKQSKNLEVPIASLLGATPGCGGAILVVAAYTSGNVSFGAVVATLIATMGDAAFLLIAVRPDAAIVVLPISFVVAVLCGFLVNGWIPAPKIRTTEANSELVPLIGRVHRAYSWYLLLLIPGLFFGICGLLSVSLPESFDSVALILSLTATAVGLFIWTTSPVRTMANCEDHPVTRMAVETSFISVWVLGGFLAYEYLVLLTPVNIADIFTASLPYFASVRYSCGLHSRLRSPSSSNNPLYKWSDSFRCPDRECHLKRWRCLVSGTGH